MSTPSQFPSQSSQPLLQRQQQQQQPQQPQKRSHQGCWTCKQKRRRCDNTRPSCLNCQRLGVHCEGYEVRLRWGTGIASRGRFTGADKPLEESIPPRPKGRKRDLERRRRGESRARVENVGRGQAQAPVQGQGRGQAQEQAQAVQTLPQLPLQTPEHIFQGQIQRESHEQGGVADTYTCTRPGPGPGPDLRPPANSLPTARPPQSQDEALFQEFLATGLNVLHSTAVNDNILIHRLPRLCEQSQALYAICLAFQVALTPELRWRFFEYFDAALTRFRLELTRSIIRLHDGTLTAGLLLCSIGLLHGLPWTMHLEGLYSILQSHGLDDEPSRRSDFRTHLIEVMGVMDMPTFTIGRQNPSLRVWRRYCRTGVRRDTVEPVTGLPRSLLDIFCEICEESTEETFWDWPGEPGSFLQCHLWEAFRLAGILTCRQQRQPGTSQGVEVLLDPSSPLTPASSTSSSRGARLPRTEVLVARILASLDALRRGCAEPRETEKGTLILNAIAYPVFVVGLEVNLMNQNPEWKSMVRDCFVDRYKAEPSDEGRLITELLEELWQLGDGADVNELAKRRGIELGLF